MEAALTDHFGTPVTLVLDIDDDARLRPARAVRRARCPEPDVAAGRPGDRGGAGAGPAARGRRARTCDPSTSMRRTPVRRDQASDAEARLLQAFPGASEVAG